MAVTQLTGLNIKDASVSLTADVTGILPIANGGTNSSTAAAALTALGAVAKAGDYHGLVTLL